MHGKLFVTLHGALLPILAANMLGLAEPLTDAVQADALGEIVNVICGNLLPGIAGPEPIFDISAPQILDVNTLPAMPDQIPSATANIGMDEGWVNLVLILDGGSADTDAQ